jgi:hypothetical protein
VVLPDKADFDADPAQSVFLPKNSHPSSSTKIDSEANVQIASCGNPV